MQLRHLRNKHNYLRVRRSEKKFNVFVCFRPHLFLWRLPIFHFFLLPPEKQRMFLGNFLNASFAFGHSAYEIIKGGELIHALTEQLTGINIRTNAIVRSTP